MIKILSYISMATVYWIDYVGICNPESGWGVFMYIHIILMTVLLPFMFLGLLIASVKNDNIYDNYNIVDIAVTLVGSMTLMVFAMFCLQASLVYPGIVFLLWGMFNFIFGFQVCKSKGIE